MVERARAPQRGIGADARRLEERGPGPQTGRRRSQGRAERGPVRRSAFHRRGRDQLQEGPQVHDGRRRPRPGTRHLDAPRPRGEGVRPVLPTAHARTARIHPCHHRRRGAVDRRVRVPLVPHGRTHPRRVPHRQLGDRRARQGPHRRMARDQEERRRRKRARKIRSKEPAGRCSRTKRT